MAIDSKAITRQWSKASVTRSFSISVVEPKIETGKPAIDLIEPHESQKKLNKDLEDLGKKEEKGTATPKNKKLLLCMLAGAQLCSSICLSSMAPIFPPVVSIFVFHN